MVTQILMGWFVIHTVQSHVICICTSSHIPSFEKCIFYSLSLPSCQKHLDHERQLPSFVNPSVRKHLKASHSQKSRFFSASLLGLSSQLSRGVPKRVITKMNPEQEGPGKSMTEASDTSASTSYEIGTNLSRTSPPTLTLFYLPQSIPPLFKGL